MSRSWSAARWALWLACATAAATSTSSADTLGVLTCENRRCACESGSSRESEFFCHVDGTRVNVNVKPPKYYSVNCMNASLSYEQLPRLVSDTTFEKVEFARGCGWPAGALGPVLRELGVLNESKLVLEGVAGAGAGPPPPRLLDGLGALNTLSLAANALTALPAGLLEPLRNLTWLDLRRNRIRLDGRSLAAVPRLRTLDLDDNRLELLPRGALAELRELRVLRLGHNALSALPPDLLRANGRLRELDLGGNPLRALPRDLLAAATELEELTVSGARFATLPAGVFATARALRRLVLWDNAEWAEAPSRLLADLPALETVTVQSAALRALPPDLLAGSSALRELQVSGTRLEELPAALLSDARALVTLDLGNNRLRALAPGVFGSLKELKKLVLKNNIITDITENAFEGLESVESVDLSGNRIARVADKAVQRMPRLRALQLDHNELERAEWALPRSLRSLRLHHNRVRQLADAWRRNAPALALLDLAHNRLDRLYYADFVLVRTDAAALDLRSNRIATVVVDERDYEEGAGAAGGAPVRVELAGNPFRCDCNLYWFVRGARERGGRVGASLVALENATCAEPAALRGRAVSALALEELQCPVPAADGCPAGCACALRPHDRALVVRCAGASRVPRPPALLNRTVLLLERANVSRLAAGELPPTLVELHMEGGALAEVEAGALPPALRVLRLRGNRLSALSPAAAAQLVAPGRRVWLADNPLRCDCEGAPLLAAVQQHYTQVADYAALRCRDGASVSLVTTGALCRPDAAVAAGSALAALGLLLGLAAALFYKYKRQAKVWLYARGVCLRWLTDADEDDDKKYDAFVSFSHLDEPFVVSELVPPLEAGPRPLRLCVHFRDWVPGEPIPAQIAGSVRDSRRTIVVLSQNYLRSAWGRVEFRVATAEAERSRAPRLIVVLVGDVGPTAALDPELRAYLQTNTYIKWGDPWFWDKLRYALPHRRRRAAEGPPPDPDRSVLRRSDFDDRLEAGGPEKLPAPAPGPPPAPAPAPA